MKIKKFECNDTVSEILGITGLRQDDYLYIVEDDNGNKIGSFSISADDGHLHGINL